MQVNKLANHHAKLTAFETAYVLYQSITKWHMSTEFTIWYRRKIKEGTPIATIMPSEYDIAVETL
jgi:hypothetical protein